MKQNAFPILVLLTLFTMILGCNGEKQPDQSKKASDTIAVTPNAASSGASIALAPNTVIMDEPWVKACVDRYTSMFASGSNGTIPFSKRTTEVAYNLDKLTKWLTDLKNNTDCDTIRVTFGVYPPDGKHPTVGTYTPEELANIKPGRFTVFLYPFAGKSRATIKKTGLANPPDDPAPPFDLGEIHP